MGNTITRSVVRGEKMKIIQPVDFVNTPPAYSIECECGLIIGGIAEKGIHTLLKKHREKGIFHKEYTEKQ